MSAWTTRSSRAFDFRCWGACAGARGSTKSPQAPRWRFIRWQPTTACHAQPSNGTCDPRRQDMARSTLQRTEQRDGQSAEEMTHQHFVRRGDLDLDAGIEHQKRLRTFQHVAWGALALLAVLAFLGAFGGGPLSKATATRDG